MGKKAQLTIEQTAEQLQKLYNLQRSLKRQKKIIALMRIKKQIDNTREDLSNYLGVHKRTLERWINAYLQGGIEQLLLIKPKRKDSKIITKDIHDGLAQRLKDPRDSFLGYWDAHRWIKITYGVEVNYHWLRKYMISKFGTKVKTPRKSHIKKDKDVKSSFLKTS